MSRYVVRFMTDWLGTGSWLLGFDIKGTHRGGTPCDISHRGETVILLKKRMVITLTQYKVIILKQSCADEGSLHRTIKIPATEVMVSLAGDAAWHDLAGIAVY